MQAGDSSEKSLESYPSYLKEYLELLFTGEKSGKGMRKEDGKDKYRKKAYTPKFKTPSKNKASIELTNIYKKALEHKPDDIKAHPMVDLMVDLASKGANIAKIAHSLASVPNRWKDRTGTYDMTMNLKNKYKAFLSKQKGIKNSFRSLTERLEPVFPDCSLGHRRNKAIIDMQSSLKKHEATLKRYLDLMLIEDCYEDLKNSLPIKTDDIDKNILLHIIVDIYPPDKLRDMLKIKKMPAKQSSHNLWDNAVVEIADELIRIGYAHKSAYSKTAELLNLQYPQVYKDKDPDLVKSIYSRCKKK